MIIEKSLLLILQMVSVLVYTRDIRNMLLLVAMQLLVHVIFTLILIRCLEMSILFSDIR
jgi:hypothetical protein